MAAERRILMPTISEARVAHRPIRFGLTNDDKIRLHFFWGETRQISIEKDSTLQLSLKPINRLCSPIIGPIDRHDAFKYTKNDIIYDEVVNNFLLIRLFYESFAIIICRV